VLVHFSLDIPRLRRLDVKRLTDLVIPLFDARLGRCEIPPPKIEASLFYRVIESESTLHAALYLGARMYAAELGLRFQQPPSRSCLPLKLSAIQSLREVLVDTSAATDETILAVIFMIMSFNRVSVKVDKTFCVETRHANKFP
jgi:hypothetical protein